MSEIGGDFHWSGIPPAPFISWQEPFQLFSTARASVVSIAAHQRQRRLWLPSYYCPDTANYWQSKGLQIEWYLDHPERLQPEWSTLRPKQGDMVVAVNYFGVRSGNVWQQWHTLRNSVVLLEDHTHDPLSAWARHSQADYAFASLRKTFSVPDGALVWSPLGHMLPSECDGQNWTGSALKLAAMIWKREYIDSGETAHEIKSFFRQLQLAGESELERSADQKLPPWSRALLLNGYPVQWRQQRKDNVQHLLEQFPASDHLHPLFRIWPEGHCPFGVVLISKAQGERDALRQFLIQADIFPPIHWQLPRHVADEALEVSQRLITLPLDHRYTSSDVDRITTVLQDYLDSL